MNENIDLRTKKIQYQAAILGLVTAALGVVIIMFENFLSESSSSPSMVSESSATKEVMDSTLTSFDKEDSVPLPSPRPASDVVQEIPVAATVKISSIEKQPKPKPNIYTYSGVVRCISQDHDSSNPVQGAHVSIQGFPSSVTTSEDGSFALEIEQIKFEANNGVSIFYSKGKYSDVYEIGEKGSHNHLTLTFHQVTCDEVN